MMKQSLWVMLTLLPLLVRASSGDPTVWAASYDPSSKTRFIPIELWTGGEWNGSRGLRMPSTNFRFGKDYEKRIRGPMPWTKPGSDKTMQVYERTNRGKRQLFALSSRGDGLGRVFDSRYPRACVDEVKFPLGIWKEGETRVFHLSCDQNTRRKIELTIEKIDFVHDGVPHSLQYHWILDGGKRRGNDMRYIYSPRRGLVSTDEH